MLCKNNFLDKNTKPFTFCHKQGNVQHTKIF